MALSWTSDINVYLLKKQVFGPSLNKRQNCAKQSEGLAEITLQIMCSVFSASWGQGIYLLDCNVETSTKSGERWIKGKTKVQYGGISFQLTVGSPCNAWKGQQSKTCFSQRWQRIVNSMRVFHSEATIDFINKDRKWRKAHSFNQWSVFRCAAMSVPEMSASPSDSNGNSLKQSSLLLSIYGYAPYPSKCVSSSCQAPCGSLFKCLRVSCGRCRQ